MKKLNMIGKACPIPVIESKKNLQDPKIDTLIVKVDNETAVNNLTRLANSIDAEITIAEKENNTYDVTIKKNDSGNNKSEDFSQPLSRSKNDTASGSNDFVVVFSSDQMGNGKEELGKILIKGFIYSLCQLDIPPTHMIFLNSGALLTTEGSNTITDLKCLEDKGTSILTCGTCANYYGITDRLAVGSITDMYGITEITVNGTKTIIY